MSKPARELRCHCGSLIARVVEGKLEVKCRRCQRLGFIDLSAIGNEGTPVEIQWLPDSARAKTT